MNSLDILLPTPSISSFFFAATASSSGTSTGTLLEQRSAAITVHSDAADGGKPNESWIDPDIVAEYPFDSSQYRYLPTSNSHVRGRQDFLSFRAALHETNPGARISVVDIVSRVDDLEEKAVVFLTCRLSGFLELDNKSRESVVLLSWKRQRNGDWVCVNSRHLHGYTHQSLCQDDATLYTTKWNSGPGDWTGLSDHAQPKTSDLFEWAL